MTTYDHHSHSRDCELAGCDAPDGHWDVERQAVRACRGHQARELASAVPADAVPELDARYAAKAEEDRREMDEAWR
jgi:hypothetical protein